VIAPPGVDRIFLHNTGANDDFTSDDIRDDLLEGVSLFHFGYPPLLKNFYENDGAELVSLFKRIKEHNIATSLDMAAIDPQSEAARADWKKILQNIMPYVDFFLPSAEELAFMLDRDKLSDWTQRAGGGEITSILSAKYDIMPMADRLMDMGAKVLLIKCGASGLYYRTASRRVIESIGLKVLSDTEAWADREGFEKSYEPEKVLSGTGAGDTSVAAFLTAALSGYDLIRCLRLATAAGASCVEGYDALSGLKIFDEYEKKINAGWKKREIIE
jgi:sugar/nucleoside kinase (ribokinase family)